MGFDEDGCQRLANAVIILASKDYRAALKKIKKNPYSKAAKAELKEIEDFFHSDWYSVLTSVDGDMILKGLREEEL